MSRLPLSPLSHRGAPPGEATRVAEDAVPTSGRNPTTLTRLTGAFIVVAVGRINDLLPWLQEIPLAKVIIILAIISAMRFKGGPPLALWKSIPPAKLTTILMGLCTVSILFSVLRSATFGIITGTALGAVITLLLTIKCAGSWNSVRTLLFSNVIASVVLVLTLFGSSVAGRAGYSSSYDPNDFAFVLVGLLPVVVTFGIVSRGAKRLLYLGIACLMIVGMLLTESRGGLLGLLFDIIAMTFVLPVAWRGRLQFHTSKSKIITRVVVLTLIAVVGWGSLPASTRARLGTVTELGSDYNTTVMDGPQSGRLAIWSRNLPMALERPWGWGAGAFGTVDGRFAGGRYRAPHNTFLQALIELGVLGLALFVAIIVSSLRYLRAPADRGSDNQGEAPDEPRAFARALGTGLIGLCVSGFFLSELYASVIWTFVALICAVGLVRRSSPGACAKRPPSSKTVPRPTIS
jgi:O-antigen ligase